MRTPSEKNKIPTSFELDLSTIDKKMDKLVKYLKNCEIDLKDDGKRFVNPSQDYGVVITSLDKRKYKEELSYLINNVYLRRYAQTKSNLIEQGVMKISDAPFPEPIDDFGSKFDAFAATNTDPNNTILQLLNVKPYKTLKIDIFDEEEITTYLDKVSEAVYDQGNISFLLTKLDSLANSYINLDTYIKPNYEISVEEYVKQVREQIFYIKSNVSGSVSEGGTEDTSTNEVQQEEYLYSLPDVIPELKNAEDLIRAYTENISLSQPSNSTSENQQSIEPTTSDAEGEIDNLLNQEEMSTTEQTPPLRRASPTDLFPRGVMNVLVNYNNEEYINVIGKQAFEDSTSGKMKNYSIKAVEQLKIKLIDFVIRKEMTKALQEKINALTFLNDFKSKYISYNFLEEKIYSETESKNIKKENLFFRLTYLRQTEEQILEQQKNSISPLNIEFTGKQFLKFESPYNSIDTNSKFVAVIGGSDIIDAGRYNSFYFFNPTILSILSDLDYIDANIHEIDPFYCLPPQSLQPDSEVRKQKERDEEVIKDSLPFSKNKNLVDSNPKAFTFIDFPSLYFLPNPFPDPLSFYESTNESLSRDKAEKIILDQMKYYYFSSTDTPSSKIIRDSNSNELFRKTMLSNGFYGPYEARKDSFADPISLQETINKLKGLTEKQGKESLNQLQDFVLAKTNISCLLKEFQTCFLPKAGNCKDIIKGFRFSELENIINKVFPESIYSQFYASLMEFKINNIKDEREKQLLKDLKDLEQAIKNNERKKITFTELDKRTDPGQALNIADARTRRGNDLSDSLEQQYEKKLKEYRDLKSGQQSEQLNALDKSRARKEMDLDELKIIDDFIELMEKNGINVEMLCSIVDLFNISPMMFNFLQLPKFPTLDLFQEVKLNLDLTIIKIIIDSILAFIIKILNELLTCGGIKGLISAALTGEADGSITGSALAALNQLATGKFDLDDFVKQNPQIDPVAYAKSFTNIAKSYGPTLTMSDTSQLNISADLGIFGSANLTSKSKTERILNVTKSSSVTDIEVKNSITGLITGLSRVMTPDKFMRTISGSPLPEDLREVYTYVEKNHPELSYLLSIPGSFSGIFRYLGNATGLDVIRQDFVAIAPFFPSNEVRSSVLECIDPISTIQDIDRKPPEQPSGFPNGLPAIPDDDVYRNLIQDLLTCSPDQLKSAIDDKVFKPLLIGRLPNGKNISAVDKANSEIIDSNFKDISNKFKDSCNGIYSNLVLKKPFKRRVMRFLKQEGVEEPKQYENSEFKDLINKGGFAINDDGSPDVLKNENGEEYIEIEEQKFIYGALFSDNFYRSSENLSIYNRPERIDISLTGSRGYPNTEEYKYSLYTANDSCWKIINSISDNENSIKFYEGNIHKQNNQKFEFKIDNQNVDTNSIYQNSLKIKQDLKEILKNSIINNLQFNQQENERAIQIQQFSEIFSEYTSDSYNQFLSLIYEKITKTISEDGLLKPINLDSLQKEKYITNIKDGLDSVWPGLSSAMQTNTLPPMVSPNIDTPLKYINFCPKPTKTQKELKIDPGLFGKYELKEFISQIMDKRKNDIVDTKTLEQMLKDDDNYLKFSIIDGLYLSLIRTACAEISMRTLFPLRVFQYNKRLVEDLMLPTYVAEMLYNEIEYKINSLRKDSLMELTIKDIDYIHGFMFSEEIDKQENNKLFKDIKKLKNQISNLKEDMDIMNSYLGKLYINNPLTEEDKAYKKKIDNYISCLKLEIKQKNKQVLLLQLRNIAYNEFIVIFDKLSYITSTNEKVKENLGNECKDIDQNLEQRDFLSILIPELLIKSDLKQVTTENTTVENFIKEQENKYKSGPNLIMEHYINVPSVKIEFEELSIKQNELNCFGVQTFGQFAKLISDIPGSRLLNHYFNGEITYGMRLVYIPDTQLKEETSINFDFNIDEVENRGKISENIRSLSRQGKNKFWLDGMLNNFIFDYDAGKPKNISEKTYAIPFMGPELREGGRKFGFINTFPIIKESESIQSAGIITVSDMLQLIPLLQKAESNKLTDLLKAKISCNEKLKEFYSIFTNENLLSNLTILSSLGVLSHDKITLPFKSIRKQIIDKIHFKMTTIYNNDDLADMYERMSTIEFFKDFNAELIAKSAIKAAVYVLTYYCQMTDPNISIALILRNAVKLSLSLASQISGPLGGPPIPTELPLALSPLAIYSMGQLPVTVFGPPPTGIGPPLTIPGMILLGADMLLLALEFSENLDMNIENDKIKEELRKYCFDLSGYKKYGV